ncbi:MAG: hypothetical protein JO304_00905 [Solirubrobacterales bacterium]|nr:hypothetical protein [Solirubrobacterales bacterium]
MARYELEHDDEARAILYEKNGSRAAAHAELVRVRGDRTPSLRTLQRAYRRLPRGAQAAIEDGDAGWRQHQPAQRYEAGFRNDHWQADHQAMEIWVKPPSKRTAAASVADALRRRLLQPRDHELRRVAAPESGMFSPGWERRSG